jgi:hypothetical protein
MVRPATDFDDLFSKAVKNQTPVSAAGHWPECSISKDPKPAKKQRTKRDNLTLRHVATRPRPNYKNQLTHARRHTRKSAALGVAHQ